jgi:hypothetical protein
MTAQKYKLGETVWEKSGVLSDLTQCYGWKGRSFTGEELLKLGATSVTESEECSTCNDTHTVKTNIGEQLCKCELNRVYGNDKESEEFEEVPTIVFVHELMQDNAEIYKLSQNINKLIRNQRILIERDKQREREEI